MSIENDFNDITLAMYLQVRWCRGQVQAVHGKEKWCTARPTKPLLFVIEHSGGDSWAFHDLEYESGQVKSEVIQEAIWKTNALGVLECRDIDDLYYGIVYQMTGIVRGYKSTLKAARRSYQRFALEDCSNPANLEKRELVVNERHFAPTDWQRSFTKLLKKALNNDF